MFRRRCRAQKYFPESVRDDLSPWIFYLHFQAQQAGCYQFSLFGSCASQQRQAQQNGKQFARGTWGKPLIDDSITMKAFFYDKVRINHGNFFFGYLRNGGAGMTTKINDQYLRNDSIKNSADRIYKQTPFPAAFETTDESYAIDPLNRLELLDESLDAGYDDMLEDHVDAQTAYDFSDIGDIEDEYSWH